MLTFTCIAPRNCQYPQCHCESDIDPFVKMQSDELGSKSYRRGKTAGLRPKGGPSKAQVNCMSYPLHRGQVNLAGVCVSTRHHALIPRKPRQA